MALRKPARLLALVAGAALWLPAPGPAQEIGWRQAVDRLARERTLAEGCASILKTFADEAPMARVQGQRLYARARADMDGLVALLIVDLTGERSPAESPELRQRLEAVLGQRRTLCRHVDAVVGAALRDQDAHALLVERLGEGASATKDTAIGLAVELWQAYRHADQDLRRTIISAIGATRWRDYAEVPQARAG